MIRVLSLGAGVQSTTVLLMSCRGVLPKLDAAVFADTQWEPVAVYAHLDWLTTEAGKHGIPVLRDTAGNLRQDALDFRQERSSGDGKRYASMPLYVLNPMVGLIDAFRAVVAHGRAPDWELLAISTALSGIIVVVAYVYFKRAERDFADII